VCRVECIECVSKVNAWVYEQSASCYYHYHHHHHQQQQPCSLLPPPPPVQYTSCTTALYNGTIPAPSPPIQRHYTCPFTSLYNCTIPAPSPPIQRHYTCPFTPYTTALYLPLHPLYNGTIPVPSPAPVQCTPASHTACSFSVSTSPEGHPLPWYPPSPPSPPCRCRCRCRCRCCHCRCRCCCQHSLPPPPSLLPRPPLLPARGSSWRNQSLKNRESRIENREGGGMGYIVGGR
jgi:hypothetical protein